MKTEKLKLILIVVLTILVLPSTISAMYQSIPQNRNTYGTANDFFINVRKMESENQTMGYSETINEDSAAATSATNNIDVHMMKNTEYGIVAMFAASQYGKVTNKTTTDIGTKISSTTANSSGVYQLNTADSIYLASIHKDVNTNSIPNVSKLKVAMSRYVDKYTNSTNATGNYEGAKSGDATKETINWYGSYRHQFVMYDGPIFQRGLYGMFAFSYSNGNNYDGKISARAVAVCGEGL